MTTDTPRTDSCPHCEAKTWEEDTGFRCGSDFIAPKGEDYTLLRTSTCYANENSQLKAEVERLRELLNRAIGYTKNALFFARTYDNKIQWNEIDKLWDVIRDLEKEALAPAQEESKTSYEYLPKPNHDLVHRTPAPEETQDGATMSERYGGCSKIESTEPDPEWREVWIWKNQK